MRKYLAELHKKPDHHKKQFALLVSGTITLFIFGIWSLVNFGIGGKIVTEDNGILVTSERTENEVSPFQLLRSSLASSLEAARNSFEEFTNNLNTVDFKSEYQEMRDGALDIYDQ